MEHKEISKNILNKNYNLFEVYDTQDVLINKKPITEGDLVALMVKKPKSPETMPAWFKTWNDQVFSPFKDDMSIFKKDVSERLDKLEKNQDNDHKMLVNLDKRLSNVEKNQANDHELLITLDNKLNNVIKLNNLRTE